MATVIDTLHTSVVTGNLNDREIQGIAGLFDAKAYKSGEAVEWSEKLTQENLSILANGNIKITIPRGIGETTVCMLSPGDLVYLNSLVSHTTLEEKFYAVGDTLILIMNKEKFDSLIQSNPLMMCQVIHGMVQNFQIILRRMNKQIADLRSYIYGTDHRG